MLDAIRATCEQAPDRVAVVAEEGALSYGELHRRARGVAARLQALGIGPESRVGLLAERSLALEVGLLGIAEAGAAYVPLEPSYPLERRRYVAADAELAALVSTAALAAELDLAGVPVVDLDALPAHDELGAPQPCEPLGAAYVLYTSGSTGRPKGAVNTHEGIFNRLAWMQATFPLSAEDVVVQKTPIGFDVSVWELYWPLMVGARLVMARPGGHQDPAYLVELVARERVTTLHFVPSMLRLFLEAPNVARAACLRWVIASGEALPAELVVRFYDRFGRRGGAELHNLYGPTEAAVDVSWWPCDPGTTLATTVPIGWPITGTTLRLLGAGHEGELAIGGIQLARGYWRRPGLTAERFVPDPDVPGGRLYRTGDLARRRTDGAYAGAYEYLGRLDHQVKIHGQRIELGEIESALVALPEVSAAVVEAKRLGAETVLVAYVVPAQATAGRAALDAEGLRARLAERLTAAMLPSVFVELAALPLSPNGKLDRRALPEPPRRALAGAPPQGALEQRLAELWAQALELEPADGPVPRDVSFFELGGSSLSAAWVANRLQAELGEIVHVVTLFDARTVAELAAYLEREHGHAVAERWGFETAAAPAASASGQRLDEARVEAFVRLIEPPPPLSVPATKNPRAVFLLGPPRSGTTLARVMLGGHSRLFAPPELELLGYADLHERAETLSGRWAMWKEGSLRAVAELFGGEVERARAFVAQCEAERWSVPRFYAWLQERLDGRLLVDKTTTYALDRRVLERAEEVFESPFYVHLVRHPRGMIASFEEARLEQLFFRPQHAFSRRELAELVWLVSHRNLLAFLATVPAERQHRLVFERLVQDPAGELARLCAALGLELEPAMLDPYASPERRMTDGLSAEGRMLGDVKFHRHRGVEAATAERWRQRGEPDFLGEPTWALAQELGYAREAARTLAPIPEAAPDERGSWPLSPAQERLWVLDRLQPGQATYNVARRLEIRGRLDLRTLKGALDALVDRHPALATVFLEREGRPAQRLLPRLRLSLPMVDLAALPPAAAVAAVKELLACAARRPFDLEHGPLVRTALVRASDELAWLALEIHHTVTDGWSELILLRDLAALCRGAGASLPALNLRYTDYAVWQLAELARGSQLAAVDAWRERLAGAPALLELPTDRPRPAVQSFRGTVVRASWPPQLADRLERLGREQGATLFMVLVAAYQALLARTSGQRDILVGVPSANRSRPELADLVGYFANNLVLRTNLGSDASGRSPSGLELLARVREAALFAYGHQELPFERLVQELAPNRALAHAPILQVAFSLDEARPLLDLGADTVGEIFDTHTGTAKFDLWLHLRRAAEGFELRFELALDLFDPPTIERWSRHYRLLLEGLAEDPARRLDELPWMPASERAQVLELGRTPDLLGSLDGVLVQFAAQVASAPDRPAVVGEGGELTYAELDQASDRLAAWLVGRGLGPERVVALCLPRSAELVIAALASLKAGAAYLPIDPVNPPERLAWVVADSGAALLLTLSTQPLPALAAEACALDRLVLPPAAPPALAYEPDRLAYVIYTSGSTGTPKGTELHHGGLAALLAWNRELLEPVAGQRQLLVAGPGFDASVWELWSALTTGACLIVPPPEILLSPSALVTFLGEKAVRSTFLPTPLYEALLDEPALATLPIEQILVGGDRLRRRPRPEHRYTLTNAYGPTETTVVASSARIAAEPAGTPDLAAPGLTAPSIGGPIVGGQLVVVDGALEPVPIGIPGELLIGGAGVGRGYRGRPALTAERFVPNPFGAPGARAYRSGDLVRWLPDGQLDFLGRRDAQVKVRGFRIELGEIESLLAQHPRVRAAVVLVRPHEERLSAYLVAEATAAEPADVLAAKLPPYLAAKLPHYMVPTAWAFLSELPLTPNGKVDRRALAALEPSAEASAGVAAESPLEELVASLFAQVLRLPRSIGPDEDFFTLGGHSLLAAQLAARLRAAAGFDPGVRGIFESPTPRALAGALASAQRSGEALPAPSAEPRPARLPMSFAQRRLWLFEQIQPGTAIYNLAHRLELSGRLDVASLAAALGAVFARHEGLRTRFEVPVDELEAVQVIAPPSALPRLPRVVDLTALGAPERGATAEHVATLLATDPYALAEGPLFRVALVRHDERHHQLLLGFHHIVSDGWSAEVLAGELARGYEQARQGRPVSLPALPVQYADYALWQRRLAAEPAAVAELQWWLGQLAGVPTRLELPADRPAPAVPSWRGANVREPFGPALSQAVADFAREVGATPFMVLLASFEAALWRWLGKRDFVLGSPLANREHVELEGLIGFFVNLLPWRSELAVASPQEPGLGELVARVRRRTLDIHAHPNVPFERLVEHLVPEREPTGSPLVQVVFAFQREVPGFALEGGHAARWEGLPSGTAKFDLALFVEQEGSALTAVGELALDRFEPTSIRRLLRSWHHLLADGLAAPARPIDQLRLLSAAERAQVVAAFNEGSVAVEAPTVDRQFEAWAARQPAAPAVVAGERRLCYGELDRRANQLAQRLVQRLGDAGPEALVAILLPRSPELVIASLAVLKAGAAWLPIDPGYPAERIRYVLDDSRALVLLTGETELANVEAAFELELPVLLVGDPSLELEPAERPCDRTALGLDRLAYVIYTSGSTGRPKGTELAHRGLINVIAWHRQRYDLRPGDRSPLLAGPGFDASVWDMWPALTSGGQLCVPPFEVVLSPSALLGWFAAEGIHVCFAATPIADGLLQWGESQGWPEGLALRSLLTGGDRLVRWPRADQPFELVNHYGPTETTIIATAGVVALAAPGSELGNAVQAGAVPDIGRSIAASRVLIVDRGLEPLPIGAPGQLVIAGPNLARGYRGRPGLTADRFRPNGVEAVAGERLYLTGDLVRWRPDGRIEFLGRLDQQVKIRGQRLELGEIESVLTQLPGVLAAAVLVDRAGGREPRLVAYLVAPGQDAVSLRAALADRLPAYMVPAAWSFVQALPLTPNGKLDRIALAQMGEADAAVGPQVARWRDPVEELLAGLFAEVIDLTERGATREAVDREANFFELGGHSLAAVRLAARIRAALGVELSLQAIFEAPTPAGLAARIGAQRGVASTPALEADPGATRGPLSFGQERLWFLDRLEKVAALYNVPVAFELRGPGLEVAALAAALDQLVTRQSVLSTVFVETEGGGLEAVVEPTARPRLTVVDLSAVAEPAPVASRLGHELGARGFDLARGPLVRTVLLRLAAESHDLVLSVHHAVFDGGSIPLFRHELAALYRAAVSGGPSGLAPLPATSLDFARWQRSPAMRVALAEELGWWREKLAGAPELLELPTDHPRPPAQSFRGAVVRRSLGAEAGAALAAFARHHGTTRYMVALAAVYALLGRWTGQRDLSVGAPVASRDRLELEGLIGFFVNTLVLRTSLAGVRNFAGLLERVRTTVLEAHAHQHVPFEQLVAELAPTRSLAQSPLFQVLVTLEEESAAAGLELAPTLGGGMVELRPTVAKFDLSLGLKLAAGGGLEGLAEYATDLFEAATMERLLGTLGVLLEAALATPGSRLADLPLLTAAERAELAAWNDRPGGLAAVPALETGLLHAGFEASAAAQPRAWAVVSAGRAMTYGELELRSSLLAGRLRRLGVGPEVAVGVCLTRTTDLVVALLAVLRAGGFYVPLDPNYPSERLGYLLEDSGCRWVLTEPDAASSLPTGGGLALPFELLWFEHELAAGEALAAPAPVGPENLAYLIYTSGSTGRPKAVAIEHRSAALMLRWALATYGPEELAGLVAPTSVAFDLSVFELFAPLAAGGTVLVAANALAPSLEALAPLPAGIVPTLLNTVPSAAQELVTAEALPPTVRTINLAGEALPRKLADQLYARPETARLWNLYGPSEDTTYSTFALVDRDGERAVSIGRPLPGTQAHVLDAERRPVPIGVPGELFLAGAGLARGYFRRPGFTAERFLPDPTSAVPGGRAYRTGDLVRWRPDGELAYLGRLDHQIKIRGFRVELGEIEAALGRLPGVADAVVLARPTPAGGLRLVAYLGSGRSDLDLEAVRAALRVTLPEVMVPSALVVLPALPRTPNGKLDRKALAARPEEGSAPERAFEAPVTPTEEVLAELFRELLGVERAGRGDSFFQLGGHSLLVMRLATRLRQRLGVDLDLRTFFEETTLAQLALRIDRLRASGIGRGGHAEASRPLAAGEHAPLSWGQQRLWFLDRLQPGSATYNLPIAFELVGDLDGDRLAHAVSTVVRRHAVLRTTYPLDPASGEPVQRIHAPAAVPLTEVDLAGHADPVRAAERWADEEGRRPFDLAHGPVLRAFLLRLAGDRHRLLLCVHHIAMDGWSIGVLVDELARLYAGEELPPLAWQFADFALWQRAALSPEVIAAQLGWWRRHLDGSPPSLALPYDRPRPLMPSGRGEQRVQRLSPAAAEGLDRLSSRAGATTFMCGLGLFSSWLARLSGEGDQRIGTAVASRSRTEVEELIGFFVDTLVVRMRLGRRVSTLGAVLAARESAFASFQHQSTPFERLVEELGSAQTRSGAGAEPFVQVVFTAGELPPVQSFAPGLELRRLPMETGTSKFELSLDLVRRPDGGFEVALETADDVFDPASSERLLGSFLTLVDAAVAAPDLPICRLPLLRPEELAQLQAVAVATPFAHGASRAEGETLTAALAARAALTPGAIALEDGRGTLSYGGLVATARAWAAALEQLGVQPEQRVVLAAGRGTEMVVGLLAILEAGGVMVPVDPADPTERVQGILADSGAVAAVTLGDHGPTFAGSGLPLLLLDRPSVSIPAEPRARVAGRNLAYVIYTSGSTGKPKGVAVEHRAAVEHCRLATAAFGYGPSDRVLQFASPSFDVAIEEVFATLFAGATLVLRGGRPLAPSELGEVVRRRAITVLNLPTAFWHVWAQELDRDELPPPSLRRVIIGGEAAHTPVVRHWLAGAHAAVELVNGYGPTETVVTATALTLRPDNLGPWGSAVIGRPLPARSAWVLDRFGEPLPSGVSGELCLGGLLARGYLDRPGLTAERFVPSPLVAPGERLYRTGDRVRLGPDGAIQYLGRFDSQVKVRGYRIELEEVDAVLSGLAAVREGAARVWAEADDVRLVAYVVTRREVSGAALRAEMRERLPDWMVPSAFVFVDALPRTATDKVDRRALPAPDWTALASQAAIAEPLSPLEEQVAAIWCEVLRVPRIGRGESFFELGGHSLSATKVLARVQDVFGVEIPLVDLFTASTLEAFAAVVGQCVVAAQGAEVASMLADLEGLSEEEIRELLAQEAASFEERR